MVHCKWRLESVVKFSGKKHSEIKKSLDNEKKVLESESVAEYQTEKPTNVNTASGDTVITVINDTQKSTEPSVAMKTNTEIVAAAEPQIAVID